MSRLVILLRDGVIYAAAADTASPAPGEREPLPGSLEAIARLNHWGFRVAVVVAHPGSADAAALDSLNAANARFHQLLSRVGGHVDGIFICSEREAQAGCPGELLQTIAERFSQPLADTPVIAGAPRDLQSAGEFGARPMLLVDQAHPQDGRPLHGEYPCYDDLGHAVEYLLTHQP
jgi:D-glycero-D-manno-heptose 1,7-bisphosphate phosphatase